MKGKVFRRLMVGDFVKIVYEGSLGEGKIGMVTHVEYSREGKPTVHVRVDADRYGYTTLKFRSRHSLELSDEVIEMNYQSLVENRQLPAEILRAQSE